MYVFIIQYLNRESMEGIEDSKALMLPGAEEIYDLELSDLEELQHTIDSLLEKRHYNPHYQTFEKFKRKASKLRSLIELELSERQEVDGLLKFFLEAPEDPAVAKTEEKVKSCDDTKSQGKGSPTIKSLSGANPFLRSEEDKMSDASSELSNTEHTRKTSTSTNYSRVGKPPPQRGYLAKQMGNQSKSAKKALHDFMREKLAATRVDTGMVMVVGKTSVQNPARSKNAAASQEKDKRGSSKSRASSQKGVEKGTKSSSSKSEIRKNKQGTRVKKEAKKAENKKHIKDKGVTETKSTQALDESKSGLMSNTEVQSEISENSVLDQKQLVDIEDVKKEEPSIDSVAIEVDIKSTVSETRSEEDICKNNVQESNKQELVTSKDMDKEENRKEAKEESKKESKEEMKEESKEEKVKKKRKKDKETKEDESMEKNVGLNNKPVEVVEEETEAENKTVSYTHLTLPTIYSV
eukprot:TRINITY_DN6466_c0_g4_i1.p1 TRINITY_DN6466_c0_g4~~TRINITY_DN6466_c0_g4_i1.p1  ORF type:complete len:465 (-),score=127.64 TRINITY_DN6466_c0_g4_i1:53-1447(-)